MAALAGDLSKAILGHSDADKAFRPWWDSIEDKLMYFFVIMSLVTLPMTFLSNTPLDCTIHSSLWPSPNSSNRVPKHARFVQGYAKKYCTETYLSPFLLYLPFVLLLSPMVLTSCEKLFIGLYKTERKLEEFYSLLVKDSLDREDVNSLETENVKDLHEIRQAFRNSSSCYFSYLYRTIAELFACTFLIIFFAYHGDITGILNPLFDCDVHGLLYQCVVPNSKFFFVVHFLSIITLLSYFLCSLYNLAWILHPRLNSLRLMLNGCKKTTCLEDDILIPTYQQLESREKEKMPQVRLDLYFDSSSRDFGLLMDLLAESSGIVQPLRILSMFDKQFQKLWCPADLQINVDKDIDLEHMLTQEDKDQEDEDLSIVVSWDDCQIADYICQNNPKTILEYTVEIVPETEVPIKSFQYYKSLGFSLLDDVGSEIVNFPLSKEKKFSFGSSGRSRVTKYSARFDGLSPSSPLGYTIHLSTELNGKTVVQTRHIFRAAKGGRGGDTSDDKENKKKIS